MTTTCSRSRKRTTPMQSWPANPHLLDAASSAVQVLTPRELADRLGLAPMG